MKDRGEELRKTWAQIPEDTEILVTHGPPTGFLSMAYGEDIGDAQLRNRIEILPKLELHVFGHTHDCYGEIDHVTHAEQEVVLLNVSMCNSKNQLVGRKPIEVDW